MIPYNLTLITNDFLYSLSQLRNFQIFSCPNIDVREHGLGVIMKGAVIEFHNKIRPACFIRHDGTGDMEAAMGIGGHPQTSCCRYLSKDFSLVSGLRLRLRFHSAN